MTWIFSFGITSVSLMSRTAQLIIWFDVHSVSLPSFHAAVVACGSII